MCKFLVLIIVRLNVNGRVCIQEKRNLNHSAQPLSLGGGFWGSGSGAYHCVSMSWRHR